MKKRILTVMMASLLIVSMVIPLTGCGKKKLADKADATAEGSEDAGEAGDGLEYEVEVIEDETFDTPYGAYSDGAEWGNNFEGSAVYLNGTTAVVSIYVNSYDEDEFSSKRKSFMKKSAKTALDFISSEAAKYGADAKFIFDESDLNYDTSYDDDDITYLESGDYDAILNDLIDSEVINPNALREKYKADGIVYLYLLNGTGDSFASVHYQEDDYAFFNEGAYVYLVGYDGLENEITNGPAVYANEILKLFGAVPLQYSDPSFGYTTDMCQYVRSTYPNDIMFSYLEYDGFIERDDISTKEISPITAYTTGLVDDISELKDYPSFKQPYKSCYFDSYMDNTKDGEDLSEYEWLEEWDFDFLYDDSDDSDFEVGDSPEEEFE